MSNKVTRTAAGAHLQNHLYLGKAYTPMANSTLNQDLAIQQSLTPSDEDNFSLSCYVFGNRGHRSEIGTDGVVLTDSNMHQPTNAGLFGILPQVLRLPENDLGTEQRANYRLRRLETHDSVAYVAYYAKILDKENTTPTLELRDSDTGTATPFQYQLSDLRPTPTTIPSNMTMVASGQYVASTAKVTLAFTEFDIAELLNVAKIIYGNEAYAIISEIGLVTGVDRRISVDVNGASVPFQEIISAQISSFVASHLALKFLNKNHTITLDVGATEPIMQLTPIA